MRRLPVILLAILAWAAGGAALAQTPPPSDDGDEAVREGDAPEGEAGESEPRTVDIIIRGEEVEPRRFEIGGGWNPGDGVYGRFGWSDRNLFGRGLYLGAAVELGDRRRSYELEWRRPWLFDRPQWLGARLHHDELADPVTDDADFDRRRTGLELAWGRRIRAFESLRVGYRLAEVDEIESFLDPTGEAASRRVDYLSSSIEGGWSRDTLDSRADPWQGLRLAAALEVAGGVLGGDADYLEPRLALAWYRPLADEAAFGGWLETALAARVRGGWIEELSGELTAQQRFFAGGDSSVRGFRRRSIAARSAGGDLLTDVDGAPLGGDRWAGLGLELHLRPPGPFRLVLFADAGGVFAPGQSLDPDLLRTSAGAELWVRVPRLEAPIRLIWAESLDPLPGDRFDELSVRLGVSF